VVVVAESAVVVELVSSLDVSEQPTADALTRTKTATSRRVTALLWDRSLGPLVVVMATVWITATI
jgi:hypothetical protein